MGADARETIDHRSLQSEAAGRLGRCPREPRIAGSEQTPEQMKKVFSGALAGSSALKTPQLALPVPRAVTIPFCSGKATLPQCDTLKPKQRAPKTWDRGGPKGSSQGLREHSAAEAGHLEKALVPLVPLLVPSDPGIVMKPVCLCALCPLPPPSRLAPRLSACTCGRRSALRPDQWQVQTRKGCGVCSLSSECPCREVCPAVGSLPGELRR